MVSGSKYDAIIVGAGPAGSAAAMHLLEQGLKPAIVEQKSFPRYQIGESLTGECGRRLRALGLEKRLGEERCPVKHGVKVFGAKGKNNFWVPVNKRNSDGELVPTTTWQVRRSMFDQLMLETAIERGADYLACSAKDVWHDGDRVAGIRYSSAGGSTGRLDSEVVVDASGQTTFLAERGYTGPKERSGYDKQIAIFSQVSGAQRDPGDDAGNTLIFYREKHHWSWFIPLDDEVVSVGVVVPSNYFKEKRMSKEAFLQEELQTLNPELTWRLENVEFVEPVRSASNYSYRVSEFTGKGFLCVGDSHRFIDPIFSFGVHFAIQESKFAAEHIARYISGETRDLENPFSDYQKLVERGQDVIQDMVDCFWEFPFGFLGLVHYSHREDMIDLFAGRLYDDGVDEMEGVVYMRKILAKRPPDAELSEKMQLS